MTWRRIWVAYCIAHTGKSLLWTVSDLLTVYVLVSRYGLTPAMAGGLFLSGLIASALADMGIGTWLGRRPGDAKVLAATALCAAGAAFPLTMLSASVGPGTVLAATLLFRVAYAGCDVPHNALMGRLAGDPERATALSRGRTLGTGMASMAAAGCVGTVDGAGLIFVLWGIGVAATVLGFAMVRLLAVFPIARHDARGGSMPPALPATFVLASVIGIVALGAAGKAVLHLSDPSAPMDPSAMLMILIVGRTATALVPLRMTSVRQGLAFLAATYTASAAVPLLFVTDPSSWMASLLLGLTMGMSNLIGWALVSLLAQDARDYGFYTMTSKVALGATGLALAGGLGRSRTFGAADLRVFVIGVSATCLAAALLCLTCRRRCDLHA